MKIFDYKPCLKIIKNDIQQKHNCLQPHFLINELPVDETGIDAFFVKNYMSPHCWLKYRWIKNDIFELKPFSPDPDDTVSKKLIADFLHTISHTPKPRMFDLRYLEPYDKTEITSDSVYDEEEIKTELLYLFRQGQSKISFFAGPTEEPDVIVYHLFVTEDSLENMLKSGYLTLEYKE